MEYVRYNFVHSMIDKYKAMNAERSGKNSGRLKTTPDRKSAGRK